MKLLLIGYTYYHSNPFSSFINLPSSEKVYSLLLFNISHIDRFALATAFQGFHHCAQSNREALWS